MRYLEKRGSMQSRVDIVLNKFRSRVNSFPPGLCPLALYRSILQMSMNQSCGKCVPCRDGLPQLAALLKKVLNGKGTEKTLAKMRAMAETIRLIHQEAPFCRVIVGGAVLTPEYAQRIEADYYAANAMETVRICQNLTESAG